MKTKIKSAALMISALILIQGCKVYHSNPVSLQQAAEESKRVKIETIAN